MNEPFAFSKQLHGTHTLCKLCTLCKRHAVFSRSCCCFSRRNCISSTNSLAGRGLTDGFVCVHVHACMCECVCECICVCVCICVCSVCVCVRAYVHVSCIQNFLLVLCARGLCLISTIMIQGFEWIQDYVEHMLPRFNY